MNFKWTVEVCVYMHAYMSMFPYMCLGVKFILNNSTG